MVTERQIRAGRALLGWSQETLATKSGISLRALNNIELGKSSPRKETLLYLRQALEEGGIEFQNGEGVCLVNEVLEIQKIEGDIEVLRLLLEDPFRVLKQGEEILGLSLDERKFFELGNAYKHTFYKKAHSKNITERILIREGDQFMINETRNYRWLQPEMFSEVPFIVYGNTVLFIFWQPQCRAVVVRNKPLADTYKKQFNVLWNNASEVKT